MKKLITIFLCLCMVFSLAACGSTPEEELASKKQAYSDFKADVNDQDVVAIDARIETLEDGSKVMMTNVKNTTTADISDVVVAFAAWDENGSPVIIKTEKLPDSTYYVIEAEHEDVTIASGETWIADQGLFLAEECYNIAYVEAIVISCTMNLSSWENSLYDAWQETYSGVALEYWMMEEMTNLLLVTDESQTSDEETDDDMPKTFEEFYKYLMMQEVVAQEAGAHLQDDGRNILMTDIKNNMIADATEICIAFVMWDADGNPLLIQSASGLTEDSYVKECVNADLTIEGNETWIADQGLSVANDRDSISHVESIVVSCKLNGSDWSNPLYSMWKEYFAGKNLDSSMLDTINSIASSEIEEP